MSRCSSQPTVTSRSSDKQSAKIPTEEQLQKSFKAMLTKAHDNNYSEPHEPEQSSISPTKFNWSEMEEQT